MKAFTFFMMMLIVVSGAFSQSTTISFVNDTVSVSGTFTSMGIRAFDSNGNVTDEVVLYYAHDRRIDMSDHVKTIRCEVRFDSLKARVFLAEGDTIKVTRNDSGVQIED